jgi:hypothetical protein
MTKKDESKEPKEASQGEVLTRRAAMKRIAAGLAGAGIVVVAGMIAPRKPDWGDDPGEKYGDAAPRAKKDEYGDAAPKNKKDEYGDAAPKNK